MTSLKFSRYYTSLPLRSFAMRDFNSRETEINQHYWSFVASSNYSRYRARRFKKIDPNMESVRLFKASGGDSSRIPTTVSDWLSANADLQNWLRLSILVSAAANLEMYLGHIARTALASDPFVRYGNPRALDGVCLVKSGIELPYKDAIEGLTKGDWNSREAKIGIYFGVGFLEVRSRKSDLEEIRKIRNEFAHGFGRSLEVPEAGTLTNSKSFRLSENKLKAYLGIMSHVAKTVDRHLMFNHIGSFELIKYYDANIKKIQIASLKPGHEIDMCFKRCLYDDCGLTVSRKFCRDVIGHYDQCIPAFPI